MPPVQHHALEYRQQETFNQNQAPAQQQLVVQDKENVNAALVPFDANLDEDQTVPSFDIAQLLSDVVADSRNENRTENRTTSAVTIATATNSTSNISNNIPRTCFANCSIGNITFNIHK